MLAQFQHKGRKTLVLCSHDAHTMLSLHPVLVWGVDGGHATLCVRTTHSVWPGGSDTPPTVSVPGCLVPPRLQRNKGRKTCTATSPSVPEHADQSRAPSAPRACLIHEFPSASRIHPGLILLMGGHWARQEDGGSSSYKQALKVEGSLGACVRAGWRGVSVCESECECLSCCLSPAVYFSFS